jgi:hypothetical protein
VEKDVRKTNRIRRIVCIGLSTKSPPFSELFKRISKVLRISEYRIEQRIVVDSKSVYMIASNLQFVFLTCVKFVAAVVSRRVASRRDDRRIFE